MSRIHEALKKAELERATQAVSGGGKDFGKLIPSSLVSNVADDPNPVLPELTKQAPEFQGPLTFELLANRCPRLQLRVDPEVGFFEDWEKGTLGVEVFRTLRSKLRQVAKTKQLRRVLITSSVPGEGKTFIASNLARSFARHADSRVLLIDGDLRVSRLHSALGAPRTPGLTDYLRGEIDEFSVVQLDPQKGFAFIPGGDVVADAGELIFGGRMKKLLDTLAPAFEWVILDSPPTLAVHDASLLADLCDGVIFVVKAGETRHADTMKAASEFLQKNLLGVVLNQTEKSDFYGSYYYSGALGSHRK